MSKVLGVVGIAVLIRAGLQLLPRGAAMRWARKNGYRFVKVVQVEGTRGTCEFVVENERGLWRTAVWSDGGVRWEDEPDGVTVFNIPGRGWREPDSE